MIQVRNLERKDYLTLHKWWVQNRFFPPSIEDLPIVNGELQGFMVYSNDVDICSGFLINTSVPNGAMMEYLVANFDVKDRQLRKDAIKLLLDTLSEAGRRLGKKYLFTSVKNKGLIEKLAESGYKTASTGTIEMIKHLY